MSISFAARKIAGAAGFKLVVDRGYPLATQDHSPVIAECQRSNAHTFVAFSYPPDTIGLTEAARTRGYNPKVFYSAVGTFFPVYRDRFKENAAIVNEIAGGRFQTIVGEVHNENNIRDDAVSVLLVEQNARRRLQ